MKKFVPHIILAIFVLYLGASIPVKNTSDYEVQSFGRLSILNNGRVKPIDSVARNALMVIRGKQTLKLDAGKLSASEWLLQVVTHPEKSDTYPIFLVNNPDIQAFLGFEKTTQKYLSFNDLVPRVDLIMNQAEMARKVDAKLRSAFQKGIVTLNDRLMLYFRLKNSFFGQDVSAFSAELTEIETTVQEGLAVIETIDPSKPMLDAARASMRKLESIIQKNQFLEGVSEMAVLRPIDTANASEWMTMGQGFSELLTGRPGHPHMRLWAQVFDAFRQGDAPLFKDTIRQIGTTQKVRYEFSFNHFQPFYKSMVLYLVCFLLVIFSFLVWKVPLEKASFYLLLLAFLVHTSGLLSRIILQGRPPVTNLYSSAVFVGWVAILLGIILELLYRNRIGTMVSAVTGFCSLIVAHHLSLQGDTMEMMQAVLDSNFWLSTHVVTITIGYSACFLAGFLGIVYVVRGLYSTTVSKASQNDLCRMVYGIICFALFFSFVGTVLGGIWADQSWGRFWGWDPKENGALLIVLWNAIILHARMSGHIAKRGMMLMAIFGNVITSFSWFGVNMLGIGLHSYGFMDKAFIWLLGFIVIQLFFIVLGAIPLKYWASSDKFGA